MHPMWICPVMAAARGAALLDARDRYIRRISEKVKTSSRNDDKIEDRRLLIRLPPRHPQIIALLANWGNIRAACFVADVPEKTVCGTKTIFGGHQF